MKTQINPAIKAHLIRGAAYLVLLVAVYAIPFALAQRNATSQSVAQLSSVRERRSMPALPRTSLIPQRTTGVLGAHFVVAPPAPNAPQVILYDQYNNAATFATLSATFTDSPPNNCDLADDFVVPGGQTWSVQSIDADGVYFNCPNNNCVGATDWNVFFYTDNAGFPGTQIYSATHQPAVHSGNTFTVNLPTPAVLTVGTYWVEIQANMTFSTEGEWGSRRTTFQLGKIRPAALVLLLPAPRLGAPCLVLPASVGASGNVALVTQRVRLTRCFGLTGR